MCLGKIMFQFILLHRLLVSKLSNSELDLINARAKLKKFALNMRYLEKKPMAILSNTLSLVCLNGFKCIYRFLFLVKHVTIVVFVMIS